MRLAPPGDWAVRVVVHDGQWEFHGAVPPEATGAQGGIFADGDIVPSANIGSTPDVWVSFFGDLDPGTYDCYLRWVVSDGSVIPVSDWGGPKQLVVS
jgi:hypothetical protein